MNQLYNKVIALPVPDKNSEFDLIYLVYKGKLTTIADYFNNILKLPQDDIRNIINKQINNDAMSLLHISTYLGFSNIFLYLLTYNPNLYHIDNHGRSFFHILCYMGDAKILQILLNWERFQNKLISIINVDLINKSHGFSKLDIIKGKLSKGVNLTETNIKRFESLQIKLQEETINLINRIYYLMKLNFF
jgi:hypothetical protein